MKVQISKKIPTLRKLRGYAFDPFLSSKLDTVGINEIVYKIPWEADLKPGPCGEYVHVIDRNPITDEFYKPVDLNSEYILAEDGLQQSVSNPQFHQQMVYAVMMNTITNFEKAMGRKVMWGENQLDNKEHGFVKQLVVYPHAFNNANAYYSPFRKAVLFGYFKAIPPNKNLYMPGSLVFSCLSHDIIAHETTHAILDGIFKYYMDQTHPDVAAFHEGFADIIALFQHFTFSEVLKNQLSATNGTFDSENLLGKLAVEFGIASGSHSALRDGIGTFDQKLNKWKPQSPNVDAYNTIFECHERGSIIVAIVFEAFIKIYNSRTKDLIKIATGGTGKLPEGKLNSDLVNRLAIEASKSAQHVLHMCIRALDYCPPVDINFGDYFRAIITADAELVAIDDRSYRIAFIEAFRNWGIYPNDVMSISEENLIYNVDYNSKHLTAFTNRIEGLIKSFNDKLSYITDRAGIYKATKEFITGNFDDKNMKGLHWYFVNDLTEDEKITLENITGLVLTSNYTNLKINTSKKYPGSPAIQIYSVVVNNRIGPDNKLLRQIVITLVQTCMVKCTHHESNNSYDLTPVNRASRNLEQDGVFEFRGGCTLIFNLDEKRLTHVISKPIFQKSRGRYKVNEERAIMQYRSTWGDYADKTGFNLRRNNVEQFAHIHKH